MMYLGRMFNLQYSIIMRWPVVMAVTVKLGYYWLIIVGSIVV